MPRTVKYVIGVLFVLRLAASFALSDGLFKSDSITYFGAVVNLGLNGAISSIQPEDEKRFAGGAQASELYEHLAGLRDPVYRPLPYQWLHIALYAPILFFWKSLTPVILINHLLFFGAGIFFFRAVAREASALAQSIGWVIYAAFPPFFYLTSQFFSEPLFMFLFAVIVLLIDKLGWEQFFLLFIGGCAVALTRPFGLVLVCALVLYSAFRSHYARAVGLAGVVLLAIGINAVVMMYAVPDQGRVHSVSTAETFYFTNTTEGNGDYDYYFVVPEAAQRDTVLQRYLSGSITGMGLITEAILQNLRAPERFVRNGYDKLSNYFFSIVPGPWIYPPSMRPQTPMKKILWLAQNLLFFVLAGAGLAKAQKNSAILFVYVFAIGLVFHFFLLARYRYFLPMLVYASAFIPLVIDAALHRAALKH
jgi:hypothetical protein